VITDVVVARRADAALVVSWRIAGDCDRVELAWGGSPDGLDHEHAVTLDATVGQAVLTGPRPGRVYVSVGPAGGGGATVAGERNVGLAGPVNFRDLGGYRSRHGGTVRWGRVFRSDALVLEEADVEQFAGLGIVTVYDLRSDLERTTNPNRIPDHIRPDLDLRVVPLISGDPDDPAGDGADLADGEAILARLYTRVIDRAAPAFGQILTGLADPACLPAVVHCMAGKDRTGLVAAVLLEILGIAEDDILADYELTGRYRNTERVKESLARLGARRQLPPEVLAGIVRAPRWAMEAALRTVRDRYGDFDAYLTGPGGADPAVPAELRRRLLTPSP